MFRLITRGRFTHDYLKGLLGAPEDREPAVRKVVEAAGGKVISFYFTTGETDFLLISEANDAESIIASLMGGIIDGYDFQCQHGKSLDRSGVQRHRRKGRQRDERVPASGQAMIAFSKIKEAVS